MNLELNGKIALVTGASRGIGLGIARGLHREGCQVILNGRDADALRRATAALGRGVAVHAADVTDIGQCHHMVAEVVGNHGAIDVLICNVGNGASVPPGQETSEEWDQVLSINLKSTTNIVEAAMPFLARPGGSIICISSICGLEALGAPVTYSAAKAALNAFVVGIARPLGKDGIRINAIAPGNILFDGSVWDRKLAEDPVAVEAMLQNQVALGRLGTPDNIADLAIFLASPRADFSTGAVYVADGGQVRS
jgi:3-oxoacyl-[acyl-carrier protein] reductase